MKFLFKTTAILTALLSVSDVYAFFEKDKTLEQKNIEMIKQVKSSVVTVWSLQFVTLTHELSSYEKGVETKYKNEGYSAEAIKKYLEDNKKKHTSIVSWELFPVEKLKDFTSVKTDYFKNTGVGSGVIIDSNNGYIITNNHVIDGEGYLIFLVQLEDGRLFRANVIGNDDKTDLALLKLENPPSDLKAIKLGNSDLLNVGQTAIAIGSPRALVQSVTQGIISALDRAELNGWDLLRASLDVDTRSDVNKYISYIQVDTAINGGNSGGPLLNSDGELIGINTASVKNMENTNLAIPSNIVINLVEQFKVYGFANPGMSGVEGTRLSRRLIQSLGLPENQQGIVINHIQENSPAQKAGLVVDDVITKINGREVINEWDFRTKVATNGAGKEISLTYLHRENKEYKEKTTKITLAPIELSENGPSGKMKVGSTRYGFFIKHQKDDRKGCQIIDVDDNGKEKGFEEYDIIKRVNGVEITQVKECRNALDDGIFGVKKQDKVRLTIDRKGKQLVKEI